MEEKVNLTKREKQILLLLSIGMTTKLISQKLFISEPTVKTHRKNLLKKLNSVNTAQLINIPMRKGLI